MDSVEVAQKMSFSFNFAIGDDSSQGKTGISSSAHSGNDATTEEHSLHLIPFPERDVANIPFAVVENQYKRVLLDNIDSDIVYSAPVVKGSYEGGALLWECTIDLLQMLTKNEGIVKGKKVMDLGCGTALLAAAAGSLGARYILAQDLNAEVLEHVASANLQLNANDIVTSMNVVLLAGSWTAVAQELRKSVQEINTRGVGSIDEAFLPRTYDTILSSETLYRPGNYDTILDMLFHSLVPESGAAYFATKRYYYGIELGGGTKSFLSACESFTPQSLAGEEKKYGLQGEVVITCEDGRSMIRDIIRVRLIGK